MTKLNRGGHKRQRKEAVKVVGPGNYLIVTEGTETEVNYFNNIKRIIEHSFRNNIIVDRISLRIEGTGRSTTVLVNEAIKNVVWVLIVKFGLFLIKMKMTILMQLYH